MQIRQAAEDDLEAMWSIFQNVIATGDTLPFPDETSLDTFQARWLAAGSGSHVASLDGRVVGMYQMGPNHAGRGSHVASATYLVSPPAQGKGVGKAMVSHSLVEAERAGYLAMQFNYVVSTNAAAVQLYRNLGFSIVGTLPKAFRHRRLGLVDAYVMYRFLNPPPTKR